MYQYFVKIVPTEVKTYAADVDTFQYAVTERVSGLTRLYLPCIVKM